jgi:hypothetical protein
MLYSFYEQKMSMALQKTQATSISMLYSFYGQKMSMALQKTQATSISSGAITAREASSRLGVLFSLPPLSLVDMIQATSGGFGTLVVPLPSCGPPLLDCLLAYILVLAPCFFFSPFLGCFLFMKFGRVSSLRIYIGCDKEWQRPKYGVWD